MIHTVPDYRAIKLTLTEIVLLMLIVLVPIVAAGQATSSKVEIITTYSENEQFYLKSIPFDSEFPSLRGKTYVYRVGTADPLYTFDRGFDSVEVESNNLTLSNNGRVIFYVIPWEPDERREGLKSITIYKDGKILKSFTETEINGCDKTKERCQLVYSNYEEVVDKERSIWGATKFEKVFKSGVSETEKFLSDFPIFAKGDTVFVTDSKRKIHSFDLVEGKYLGSESFEAAFDQLKNKGRFNRTELQRYDSTVFLDYPKLTSGRATEPVLAAYIGMTAVDIADPDERYKRYQLTIKSSLKRDGTVEIEEVDVDPELPKEKIIEFFKQNRFDTSAIPEVFEKWYVGEEYFYFRKRNTRLARAEKQQENARQREEFKKRLTLDRINGVYIPRNLEECFLELDKLLPEVDIREMKALPKSEDMIRYHLGLGMWIRNNWGLWGGSRLQTYFQEKGIRHPDNMSGLLLSFYYDWLHGQNDDWKAWEKNPAKKKE